MNRTVGFLDILGFKSRLEEDGIVEVARAYEEAVKMAKNLNRMFQAGQDTSPSVRSIDLSIERCKMTIFSDSIILVSSDDSADSCLSLLMMARNLFVMMLAAGFPLRGGITAGELHYNEVESIVLGPALTKAYLLESSQEWCGISIDNSVWHCYPRAVVGVDNPLLRPMFPNYNVPLKGGGFKSMRIINWRANLVAKEGSLALLQKARVDRNKPKWAATIKFLQWAKEIRDLYPKDGADRLPEVYIIWIGDIPPPFPHGDDL